ncbi:hypothetical protein ACP70R_027117 [Stipagrostis hirtigluma subsp. patula]
MKLKVTAAVVLALCVLFTFHAGRSAGDTKFEVTVRKEVENAIRHNARIGPALVRLLFHDCWVNGCDGSVLLDETPTDGTNTEKKAANNIGLAGFELIDTIKRNVGDDVSCADIVVFAARDATSILSGGKITYPVAGGRMDGVVSSAAIADANLPESNFDFDQLRENFAAPRRGRNFTVDELVALTGAHAIGVSHLSSYADRLTRKTPADEIDSSYRAALNRRTPPALLKQGKNPTVLNNVRDEADAFQKEARYDAAAMGVNPTRQVLDNSFYHNTLVNKVLFESDWVLLTDDVANSKLQEYRDNPDKWRSDFADAMAKLSNQPALGKKLEIRKNCRFTNKQ